jgi:hypothetical protein
MHKYLGSIAPPIHIAHKINDAEAQFVQTLV